MCLAGQARHGTHQNSPTEAGSHFVRGGTPGMDSSMPLKVPVAPQKWLGEYSFQITCSPAQSTSRKSRMPHP